MEAIKEFGSIIKEIYKNVWVTHEVNATIKTDYYRDERILLKDLLTPQKSPVYQTQKFLSSGARKGAFKSAFADELLKGSYPNLIRLMGQPPSISSRTNDEWPVIDSTNEIWSNEYGLSIYFPYSEDYSLVSPFLFDLNTINGQLVTVVTAYYEADSGPGAEPYLCAIDPDEPLSLENLTICYNTVTVDDDYADGNSGHKPTHIAGVGAEPTIINNPSQGTQVYVVFVGDIKFTQQYDRLISFTGNGGGPELRFIRGDGYLQPVNGQITNATNTISADYKRKDKGDWKSIYSLWDSDWETANQEQVFGIYEDDTQGSKTFSGSLTTMLSGGSIGPIGFSITVQTQDNLIRQIKWDRTSFYQYNQGGLNNGCGTRSGWTVYDCNGGVVYTMPTQ